MACLGWGVALGVMRSAVMLPTFTCSTLTPPPGGKTEQARANFDKLLNTTTAESAVLQILRAVEGNQRRVLVGLDAKFLDKLVRVLGSWYQPLTTMFAKRDLKG